MKGKSRINKKDTPKNPVKSNPKPLFTQQQIKIFTILGLIIVGIFSFYIRYEDFPEWKKVPHISTYQDEYQMGEYDSYLYLQLAKDIVHKTYSSLDTMRFFPQGAKNPLLPPLSSFIVAKTHLLTGIPLATIAILLPVFLSLLIIPIVFVISKKYNFSNFSSIIATFFTIYSLTFIVRSRIGIFDTDSMNVVFMMLVPLCFMLWGEIQSNKKWIFFASGWIFTFLFYLWWNTASSIVLFSGFVAFAVAFFINFKSIDLKVKIGITTLLLIPLLIIFGDQLIYFVSLVSKSEVRSFKILDEISELIPVGLKEFGEKTAGNFFLLSVMILGLVWIIIKNKLRSLYFITPFILAFLAFFAGNRFLLFSAPILGLGMGGFIQFVWDRKFNFSKLTAIFLGILFVIISIHKNNETILKGYSKPAAFDNMHLLDALKNSTPDSSLILTNWDIGYQVRYYLDRYTFADGELADRGDILYYASLPLATDDFAFSVNFTNFYISKRGIMEEVYELYPDKNEAFKFLKSILKNKPDVSFLLLEELESKNQLKFNDRLKNVQDWMTFLYPTPQRDVYVLLHQYMLQTMSWFKQGNINLQTMETVGLPLYLQLNNLKQAGNIISNNEIRIDIQTGTSIFQNQSRQDFAVISTFGFGGNETKEYKKTTPGSEDNRFHFNWNRNTGYGVAMSKEVSQSVFHKLYMTGEPTTYFVPVDLRQPFYQIWKMNPDTWENNL